MTNYHKEQAHKQYKRNFDVRIGEQAELVAYYLLDKHGKKYVLPKLLDDHALPGPDIKLLVPPKTDPWILRDGVREINVDVKGVNDGDNRLMINKRAYEKKAVDYIWWMRLEDPPRGSKSHMALAEQFIVKYKQVGKPELGWELIPGQNGSEYYQYLITEDTKLIRK